MYACHRHLVLKYALSQLMARTGTHLPSRHGWAEMESFFVAKDPITS